MATQSPQTIICGVTCACAQEKKGAAAGSAPGEPKAVDCMAHGDCQYAKNGECSCADGVCKSSQNKAKCTRATEGKCDCAAGECKRMNEIKQECPNCPGCDCAAGECKAAKLPIS